MVKIKKALGKHPMVKIAQNALLQRHTINVVTFYSVVLIISPLTHSHSLLTSVDMTQSRQNL